ncbi:MAG: hypothetical protein KAT23_03860, partial [Anaerolineales bacterium]|nr:hypothetical protein [Anaerolineales bacterium]
QSLFWLGLKDQWPVPMSRCHVTTLPRDGEIETIRAKSLDQEVADDREHGSIIIEDRLCFVHISHCFTFRATVG